MVCIRKLGFFGSLRLGWLFCSLFSGRLLDSLLSCRFLGSCRLLSSSLLCSFRFLSSWLLGCRFLGGLSLRLLGRQFVAASSLLASSSSCHHLLVSNHLR